MTLRTITKTICIGVAVLLICYDVIPFLAPERGDTISEVIAKWGLKFFSLPFAFGVLLDTGSVAGSATRAIVHFN